ncbi:hypothetical protein N008_07790 [Hymenobacter sp. APR13]|nr:hypothetical protein N008_07790 [Hymenobacter sp. APR13]
MHPNTAHCHAVNGKRQVQVALVVGHGGQEVLSVVGGVGMRKRVAQVLPDASVVGVAGQGRGIGRLPGPQARARLRQRKRRRKQQVGH